LNILFLTQFFSATRGGGEVIFTQWAEELCKRGHNVYVICHRMKNSQQKNKTENVQIIEVPPSIVHKGGLPPSISDNILYLTNSIKFGLQVVKERDIHIIHSNNFTPIIAGSFISKITGIPHVATIHDIFSLAGKNYWRIWSSQFEALPLTQVIGPVIEKITVKIPGNIIHTVSETTKQDLIRFGARNPIVVIPNGVDLNKFRPNNTYCNNHQLVFIGRLIFYKNLSVVIRALKIVTQTIPDAYLIVVGDGPSRKQWQSLAERMNLNNSIKFTGYVSEEEKLKILNESAVLVLPSLIEGFGLVIIEAFAMKKPVIASMIAPMTEIISHGIDGYLVPPFNEQEWAKKIIYILQHPEIASLMGNRGREKVEKHFSIQKVVNQLEKLYTRLNSSLNNF